MRQVQGHSTWMEGISTIEEMPKFMEFFFLEDMQSFLERDCTGP